MGITKSLAAFLAIASKTWGVDGPVLVLGKQHVYVTLEEWTALCKDQGLKSCLDGCEAGMLTDMPGWIHGKQNAFISDTTLLRGLGCAQMDFLDVSAYEGANILHDLNLPIPEALRRKYKTIIDAGTSEHIFDVKTCLNNLYEMVQPGGTIIHFTQGNNYLNHGFYQFSPTLFYDFYASRGIENMQCYLTYQGFDDCRTNRWNWYTCGRQATGAMALDAGSYGLTFIAKKSLARATAPDALQQGYASSLVPYPPPARRIPRPQSLLPGIVRASLRRFKLRRQLWKRL